MRLRIAASHRLRSPRTRTKWRRCSIDSEKVAALDRFAQKQTSNAQHSTPNPQLLRRSMSAVANASCEAMFNADDTVITISLLSLRERIKVRAGGELWNVVVIWLTEPTIERRPVVLYLMSSVTVLRVPCH